MFAFGENKMGQLGLGNQTDAVPSPAQVSPLLPVLPLAAFWVKNRQIWGVLLKKKVPSRAQTPFGHEHPVMDPHEGFICSCGGKIKCKNCK